MLRHLSILACLLLGCSGSASYARFRRAATEGTIIAAEEVRAADFIDVHAEQDAPRLAIGTTTQLPVLLDARLGSPVVAASGGRAILQISIRGGASLVREPANVVVVLDVSGSMRDADKIGAVRHALARFVEGLDAGDRLALVTFADDAHVALAPSEVGAARASILSAIGALSAYGGTNLDAGLERGLQLAQSMQPYGGNARVVLLSDGVATIGETDPRTLVHYGEAARARTIALTTVGMGEQIDFALLEALAHGAGGSFHYVDRPAEVERVFGSELASLTALAARDAHVSVVLPLGARLARSYDERTQELGSVLDTPLGDVGADEAFVIVHEIDLAPGAGVTTIPIEVSMGALDRRTASYAHVELALTQAGATNAIVDASVLRNVTLGRIAWSVREASHLVDVGDTAGAGGFAQAALADAIDARTLLVAMGETERASSLDEPIALLGRTASLLPAPGGSSAFAGWR